MKTKPFSRRGFLMGAATLAASRVTAATYTSEPHALTDDGSPQAGGARQSNRRSAQSALRPEPREFAASAAPDLSERSVSSWLE